MTVETSVRLPRPGASLLLAFSPPSSEIPSRKTVLIVGSARIATARAFACLEAGLGVAVAHSSDDIDPELNSLASRSLVALFPACLPTGDSLRSFLDAYPALHDDLLFVLITDSLLLSPSARSYASALSLRRAAHQLRLPLSVADYPTLSDFTFPSTHRFPVSQQDPTPSPLQIALTTNSNSCRLASRIRRQIVSSLPKSVGGAVRRVGELRAELGRDAEGEESWLKGSINEPVEQLSSRRCKKIIDGTKGVLSAPQANYRRESRNQPYTPPPTPPITGRPFEDSQLKTELSAETKMRFIAQICTFVFMSPSERCRYLIRTFCS
jgi:siroheme synthase (precorrin-2 oxidase/ferrochelatase)